AQVGRGTEDELAGQHVALYFFCELEHAVLADAPAGDRVVDRDVAGIDQPAVLLAHPELPSLRDGNDDHAQDATLVSEGECPHRDWSIARPATARRVETGDGEIDDTNLAEMLRFARPLHPLGRAAIGIDRAEPSLRRVAAGEDAHGAAGLRQQGEFA